MTGSDREIGGKHADRLQCWRLFQIRPLRPACVRGAVWAVLPLIAALVLYWGYGEYQKRLLPRMVIALVQDASARMQDALRDEVDASEGDSRVAERLEQHAIAADQSLMKLRDMDIAAIEELSAAADDYLLTVREILRRRAADYRYRSQVSASVRSLRAHMRSDNRTGAWVTQAVRGKTRLEGNFRRYRMTAVALAGLLAQYPAAHARLAAHVEAPLIGDGRSGAARLRTVEALARIDNEVQRASQLNAYR